MDVMALRRHVMGQKWNYLAVKWKYYAFISGSGKMFDDTKDTSSYTENAMLLKAGTYCIKGFNSYNGSNNINYRIHEYNANDVWSKQIASLAAPNNSAINFSFTINHDAYVRISMAIVYFTGTMTKTS